MIHDQPNSPDAAIVYTYCTFVLYLGRVARRTLSNRLSMPMEVEIYHCYRILLLLVVSIYVLCILGGEGLTEEGVVERHCLNTFHVHIIQQIRIKVEEHRHVHCLACIQPLFLEAETLNLAEIRCTLCRRDAVRSYPYNILVAIVGCLVEGQGGLAWEDADLTLLGSEFPRKNIGDGSVECDFDSVGRSYRDDAA